MQLETKIYQKENSLKIGKQLKASAKDLFGSHFLAKQLATRDITSQYRQSYLGVIWSFITDAINLPTTNTKAARGIMSKINFPKEALVLSGIYKLRFNSSIKIGLLIILIFAFGIGFYWSLLLLAFAPSISGIGDGDILNNVDVSLYVVRQDYTKRGMLNFVNEKHETKQIKNISLVYNGYDQKAKFGYGYGNYANGYHEDEKKEQSKLDRIRSFFKIG